MNNPVQISKNDFNAEKDFEVRIAESDYDHELVYQLVKSQYQLAHNVTIDRRDSLSEETAARNALMVWHRGQLIATVGYHNEETYVQRVGGYTKKGLMEAVKASGEVTLRETCRMAIHSDFQGRRLAKLLLMASYAYKFHQSKDQLLIIGCCKPIFVAIHQMMKIQVFDVGEMKARDVHGRYLKGKPFRVLALLLDRDVPQSYRNMAIPGYYRLSVN